MHRHRLGSSRRPCSPLRRGARGNRDRFLRLTLHVIRVAELLRRNIFECFAPQPALRGRRIEAFDEESRSRPKPSSAVSRAPIVERASSSCLRRLVASAFAAPSFSSRARSRRRSSIASPRVWLATELAGFARLGRPIEVGATKASFAELLVQIVDGALCRARDFRGACFGRGELPRNVDACAFGLRSAFFGRQDAAFEFHLAIAFAEDFLFEAGEFVLELEDLALLCVDVLLEREDVASGGGGARRGWLTRGKGLGFGTGRSLVCDRAVALAFRLSSRVGLCVDARSEFRDLAISCVGSRRFTGGRSSIVVMTSSSSSSSGSSSASATPRESAAASSSASSTRQGHRASARGTRVRTCSSLRKRQLVREGLWWLRVDYELVLANEEVFARTSSARELLRAARRARAPR